MNPTELVSEDERRNLRRLKADPQGLYLFDVEYEKSNLFSEINPELVRFVKTEQKEGNLG